MGKLTVEFKVGLLMLAGFVGIVYGSILVTSWAPGQSKTYPLIANFDNVSGLSVGAPVQIAGVKVGQVASIALEGSKAKVTLHIYQKHVLHIDSTAAIKSLGILGDKYINLHPGTITLPTLPSGAKVRRIQEGLNLDGIVENLGGVLGDLKSVSSSLHNAIGSEKGRARLEAIVNNLAKASADIERITQVIGGEIEVITKNFSTFSDEMAAITTENREDIRKTTVNFAAFSQDLQRLAADNREALTNTLHNLDTFSRALAKDGPNITGDLRQVLNENKDRIGSLLNNLDSSTFKINETMDSLRSISRKIDRGEGSIGRLVNDEKTVDELNEALTGINRFLTDATRLKLDIGGSTEYLSKQQAFKSYFDIRLQPLKDRYYLLQLVDRPNGKLEKKTTTTTNSGGTQTTEETAVKDEFVLSLLIAQRYFNTEIRGGIIENQFGLAASQFYGKKDQYRIGLDVWDFGRDEGVHLKVSAHWRFFSNAFLVVGGDDLINKNTELRDAFFGIGLHFNEDPLKPLLGTVTGALTP